MIESLLETAVSSLISFAAEKWKRSHQAQLQDFDFVLEREDGRQIAMEVLGRPPEAHRMSALAEQLTRPGIDAFILLTAEPPSPEQQQFFQSALQPSGLPATWIGINDLPNYLEVESPGDLRTEEGLEALQRAALVSNAAEYRIELVGLEPDGLEAVVSETQKGFDIPSEYLGLQRQFPHRSIVELYSMKENLEVALGLGRRVENVTVVLSDLKNFSTLVKTSRTEDLRDTMSKYYFKARELVWIHGGVLDKFIGDAVLGVFGYPSSQSGGSRAAVEFALDLVTLGQKVLLPFAEGMNEIIPTGTRVGIATGDIWPLNIGRKDLELSFVGDVINLAARLEKNSDVDGCLLSNTTRVSLEERVLSSTEAKGQLLDSKAWKMRSGLRA